MKPLTSLRIFVITAGWVIIGRTEVETDGSVVLNEGGDATITGAACIRRWGTSKGLGQIASHGPTSETIIDPTPVLRVPNNQVIYTIECDENAWKKKIPAA